MKISIFFFLFFSLLNPQENSIQPFDKQAFYHAMLSGNLIQLNALFVSIKTVSLPDREAYDGALLMKKAGLVDNKKNQLSLFRSGKQILDNIILKNNENCEFRFLRLIIQENAPSILGYNKQISEDCILIKKKFRGSTISLQNIILDYSKKSKKLNFSSL